MSRECEACGIGVDPGKLVCESCRRDLDARHVAEGAVLDFAMDLVRRLDVLSLKSQIYYDIALAIQEACQAWLGRDRCDPR